MGLRYEIVMTIQIEPTANFLEVADINSVDNLDVIKEKINDAIYDIDDLYIEELDIIRRLDEVHDEDLQSGSREVNYNRP